ncbi:MAG: hypothetical protein RMJ16_02255 [Thermoguttaceae bacterium]|nr:hypothetical protein [Thermoguttaceae bacterium]
MERVWSHLLGELTRTHWWQTLKEPSPPNCPGAGQSVVGQTRVNANASLLIVAQQGPRRRPVFCEQTAFFCGFYEQAA